ncbi:Aste57867_24423 [Aphanomyces stellatus]|uniref:Aste57867_24423 protein n=1 Tax=Aphanomyces stellatus TaxID=120398 RepID=A0A485LR41_9STRA|nr:hypothetical protein As57867_024347 [Aphanomyces stellatus]VFU01063.1 Aste57867_24423 [Aphanomyces stellatus]
MQLPSRAPSGNHLLATSPSTGQLPKEAPPVGRVLYVNDHDATVAVMTAADQVYTNNHVHTSKYTLVTFFPKTLFEQFRRVANFYFLVISLLQLCTPYSPTNKYSTVGPLTLVLVATMVKEAVEDKARHDADRTVNHAQATVYDREANMWRQVRWQTLQVGDVIHVADEQQFPADVVLLTSSSGDGQACVQTANLDGETDLKIRTCPDTRGMELEPVLFPQVYAGEIVCEQPNRRLYSFAGVLKLTDRIQNQSIDVPLTINNVVLRGMSLSQTTSVTGVTPSKFSRLDAIANRAILFIFSVLFVVCCVSTALSLIEVKRDGDTIARMLNVNFTSGNNGEHTSFVSAFLASLILYNNLVPISLYISLEVVKWYQAKNMEADKEMMDPDTGRAVLARTSNLNEDVGQIKYLFSDKTGTITKNEMVLKFICLDETVFDGVPRFVHATKKTSVRSDSSQHRDPAPLPPMDRSHRGEVHYEHYTRLVTLGTNPFSYPGSELSTVSHDRACLTKGELAQHFFRCLLLCHTATVGRDKDIRASSPDEAALLRAAVEFNCRLVSRTATTIEISLFGALETFEILAINEFDSLRKCMSIIVRQLNTDVPENLDEELWVFCKGADRALLPKLQGDATQDSIGRLVQYFASLGLRTLVFGWKTLSPVEYSPWFVAYSNAKSSLVRRDAKLSDCARSMETHMTVLGATGVEDQLQDGVADCFDTLSDAGINIWMLTGDKDETAVSVGTSSGLISEQSHLVILNETTKRGCLDQIATARRKLKKIGLWRPGVASRDVALVVNGEALDCLLAPDDVSGESGSRVDGASGASKTRATELVPPPLPDESASSSMANCDARSVTRTKIASAKSLVSNISSVWDAGGLVPPHERVGARPQFRRRSSAHTLPRQMQDARRKCTSVRSGLLQHGARTTPQTKIDQPRLANVHTMPTTLTATGVAATESAATLHSSAFGSETTEGTTSHPLTLESTASMNMHSGASLFGPQSRASLSSNESELKESSSGLAQIVPQRRLSARSLPNRRGSRGGALESRSATHLRGSTSRLARKQSSNDRFTGWLSHNFNVVERSMSSTSNLHHGSRLDLQGNGTQSDLNSIPPSLFHSMSQFASKAFVTLSNMLPPDGAKPGQSPPPPAKPLPPPPAMSDLSVAMFMQLVTQCRSVIACRLSPMQKAQIVALVKASKHRPMTMAIGDGGNDVSMIQEAHIGVGIYGHEGKLILVASSFLMPHSCEGMQAVRSADFAIGQFRFLSRLILAHGRWNYRRVSIVILFSFYKNMALIMTLFIFSFFNNHSGQTLYDSYLMVGWNVLYTFFPILVLGIVDEDISYDTVKKFPFIFRTNQMGKDLNGDKVRQWVATALLHSFAVFLLTTFTTFKIDTSSSASLFLYGTAVYGVLVVAVSFKAATTMQHMHRWTRWHYASIGAGPVLYIVFVASYSEVYETLPLSTFSDFFGLAAMLFSSASFWLVLVLVAFTVLMFDIVVLYLYRMYVPTNQDIVEEIDCGLDGGAANVRTRSGGGSARGAANALLPLGDYWRKQLRKNVHLTEHEELCFKLSKYEHEVLREATSDVLDEKDGCSVTTMPPIHPITMEFMGDEFEPLEAEYNRSFATREAARIRFVVFVALVLIPPYSIVEYLVEHETNLYVFRVVMFLGALLYHQFVRSKRFVQHYDVAVLAPMALAGVLFTQAIQHTGKFSAAMFVIVLFSIMRVKFVYALWLALFNFCYFMLSNELGFTNVAASSETFPDEQVLFTLFVAFLVSFGAYGSYHLQLTMKLEFVQLRILKYEERRSLEIVKNMLPVHVVARLENGATLISDEENDVTLLFCDISDYTSLMERFNPREMVVLLDRIYSLFDKLCIKHGVRKMETVGKIYFACAGLRGSAKGKEAALRIAALAHDMMKFIGKCGNHIQIRVGIHSGRVVSGLVGVKKQQFSLFGDTVNTASRMQSTGLTGRIQLSHVTFELLQHDFAFEARTVEAKGKGTMHVHVMGRPMTALAQRACRGQLNHKIPRKTSNLRRMSLAEELQKSLTTTWEGFTATTWRSWFRLHDWHRRVVPLPSSAQSVVGESDTTSSQIQDHMLHFKDPVFETTYTRAKWAERREGSRRTFLALGAYLLYAICRDAVNGSLHEQDVISGFLVNVLVAFSVLRVLLVVCFVWRVVVAKWRVSPHATHAKPNYVRKLVLATATMLALALPNVFLWVQDQHSITYSHVGLDIVVVMFLASTGGALMHTHTIIINAICAIFALVVFLVLQTCYQAPTTSDEERIRVYPMILTLCIAISNVMSRRDVEFFCRRRFLLYTRTGIEATKADRLLYNMLPTSVVAKLKNGTTVCDQHHQVGILFSDIKGFTSIAARADTDRVVQILASLFTAFDKLTAVHGVFKMQTIGDAYVIVSGLPYADVPLEDDASFSSTSMEDMSECLKNPNVQCTVPTMLDSAHSRNKVPDKAASTSMRHQPPRQHIRSLIRMATDMHREVAKVMDPNSGEPLQMRIGIHIGSIIAGVIGTSTLRYDMWGPDALTANEMESNGVPGKILVSKDVMEVAEECPDLRFTFHRRVALAGANMNMDTYIAEHLDASQELPLRNHTPTKMRDGPLFI